jgi:transposase InsO family protein
MRKDCGLPLARVLFCCCRASTARRCRRGRRPTRCGADFKGEFKLGNGRYCYPLTVSDHASRYLLLCEATREAPVIGAFQRLFRDRGLPIGIRSDNGLPFASPNGLYNLSRRSVWWLRLGIAIERIKPGRPQPIMPQHIESFLRRERTAV